MNYTATEMMTIAAARATHAPDVTLVYESGTIEAKPDSIAKERASFTRWMREKVLR